MVYIHVPFCRSFCIYCDFYSEICSPDKDRSGGLDNVEASGIASDRDIDVWTGEVSAEALARQQEIADGIAAGSPDTLYIGGGTPSLLPLTALERILKALPEGCGKDEFTVEVNPDDIARRGPEYVLGLKALGVSRVSMGIQSFDDRMLRWMRRRHDSAAAVKAFGILREAGIENISIDLMFGIPGLSKEVWKDSIDRAVALSPEHISAYQLMIEEGSDLAGLIGSGALGEAPEEECREQYGMLCAVLSAAGYGHYEISNWAKPGRRARHNYAYWQRLPYVGLGPGAHSLSRVQSLDGQREVRSWNEQKLHGYGRGEEVLSEKERREEKIMLALRTSDGIEASALANCPAAEELLKEGALVRCSDRIRIPEDRFFVSDDIISGLF